MPALGVRRHVGPVNLHRLWAPLVVLLSLSPPSAEAASIDAGAEPDLPPIGRSVFDAAFTTQSDGRIDYEVPYPFDRIVQRLDELSGNTDGLEPYRLQMVMIPLGRCVDRDAAAPDYFRSPRLVVAADSEDPKASGSRPVYIRDRLFLGYQPRAETIQIISYNEMAGRFEFQSVRDYAPGKTPTVSYARRAECTGCHQNAGPLFPRVRWGETSANLRVMQRLRTEADPSILALFGRRSDQAYFADGATDRGNMLPVYQTLWRTLCRHPDDRNASIRCRAGAFEFALQSQLRAAKGTYARSPLIADYFVPMSLASFEREWPTGLTVPSADVPTRYPLHGDVLDPDADALELLEVRAPKMQVDQSFLPAFIEGLAASLPTADLTLLDERIFELGVTSTEHRWTLEGSCRMSILYEEEEETDLSLVCRLDNGFATNPITLAGAVTVQGEKQVLPSNRWTMTDQNMFIALLKHDSGAERVDGRWRLRLDLRAASNGLHAWLANEGALAEVLISWRVPENYRERLRQGYTLTGEVQLKLVHGYDQLSGALASLIEKNERGEITTFDDRPYQGTRIMADLLRELDAAPPPWCCHDWSGMPAPTLSPR